MYHLIDNSTERRKRIAKFNMLLAGLQNCNGQSEFVEELNRRQLDDVKPWDKTLIDGAEALRQEIEFLKQRSELAAAMLLKLG